MVSLALLVVTASAVQGQEKKVRKERNRITEDEIEHSSAKNALQAVTRLRPAWLSSRGSASLSAPMTKDQGIGVYVDGVRRGSGVQELETVPIEQVKEIRFFSVEEAVTQFGSENPLGAIE